MITLHHEAQHDLEEKVTVEVLYPGKVFHFDCSREAAEWLQAQFKDKEWIHAKILQPTQETLPDWSKM